MKANLTENLQAAYDSMKKLGGVARSMFLPETEKAYEHCAQFLELAATASGIDIYTWGEPDDDEDYDRISAREEAYIYAEENPEV